MQNDSTSLFKTQGSPLRFVARRVEQRLRPIPGRQHEDAFRFDSLPAVGREHGSDFSAGQPRSCALLFV